MKSPLRYLVAARQSEMAELAQLRDACALVQHVSRLVHQLQKERGLSNLYLASAAAQGAGALSDQAQAVNGSVATVRAALEAQSLNLSGGHGARLFSAIAYLLQGLDALPALRERVHAQALPVDQSTAAFVRLISACLAVVFEAADSACDPDISRLLVAMFHFMQGKEIAGQERAAGAAAFGSGLSDVARQHHWLHLIELQDGCFQVFAEFAPATPEMRGWEDVEQNPAMAVIERLRRVACTAREGERLDAALGERWFAACTQRLDAMHRVEGHLADELVQLCERKLAIACSVLASQQVLLREEEEKEKENEKEEGEKEAEAGSVHSTAVQAQDSMGFFIADVPGRSSVPPAYGPQLERSILGLVQEQSQRLQTMQAEIDLARTALQERKAIERAKGVLMNLRHMSESEAHKLLRQTAMNQNRRMLDVAQAVLSTAQLLPAELG